MRELCGATSIDYIYGTEGIAGFIVNKDTNNEATYVYRKNIFGDVTAVYNDDGILQCTYEYDAWGNHVRKILKIIIFKFFSKILKSSFIN